MGTLILVGLLRRSAVVLDEESPAIGIAPDALSGAWVRELGAANQQEVNRRIAADDYAGACALTDLKSRFLVDAPPGAQVRRPVRRGGLLVRVALALLNAVFWDEGRVARRELAEVSPFLSGGKRSGEGIGPGFVGTLDDAWYQLDAAEQAEAAEALVQALRERGIRQIMIYDDDQRLRVQALGSQAPRVIR